MDRPETSWMLIAEDDSDDVFLIEEALNKTGGFPRTEFVPDGERLMECLERIPQRQALPALILLDINMPKKNGYECLSEIKSHPRLKSIPVVLFTTASGTDNVSSCYKLGGNSFVQKPPTFDGFLKVFASFRDYWFNIVCLPVPSGN